MTTEKNFGFGFIYKDSIYFKSTYSKDFISQVHALGGSWSHLDKFWSIPKENLGKLQEQVEKIYGFRLEERTYRIASDIGIISDEGRIFFQWICGASTKRAAWSMRSGQPIDYYEGTVYMGGDVDWTSITDEDISTSMCGPWFFTLAEIKDQRGVKVLGPDLDETGFTFDKEQAPQISHPLRRRKRLTSKEAQ